MERTPSDTSGRDSALLWLLVACGATGVAAVAGPRATDWLRIVAVEPLPLPGEVLPAGAMSGHVGWLVLLAVGAGAVALFRGWRRMVPPALALVALLQVLVVVLIVRARGQAGWDVFTEATRTEILPAYAVCLAIAIAGAVAAAAGLVVALGSSRQEERTRWLVVTAAVAALLVAGAVGLALADDEGAGADASSERALAAATAGQRDAVLAQVAAAYQVEIDRTAGGAAAVERALAAAYAGGPPAETAAGLEEAARLDMARRASLMMSREVADPLTDMYTGRVLTALWQRAEAGRAVAGRLRAGGPQPVDLADLRAADARVDGADAALRGILGLPPP